VARALLDKDAVQDFLNWQKAERSWHHMYWAYQAADKAAKASKAEVVIMAARHKRWVSCGPGQLGYSRLSQFRALRCSVPPAMALFVAQMIVKLSEFCQGAVLKPALWLTKLFLLA